MHFTKYNSMRDILAWPRMEEYLGIFFSKDMLKLFPEEYRDRPLAYVEHVAKSPWDDPFSVIADQLIDAVNTILDIVENKRLRCISLWDEDETDWTLERNERKGKEQVFLLTPVRQPSMADEKKPAVLICPGGGYGAVCFSGEGNPVRYFMEANGYRPFVLKYRVYPEQTAGGPQDDAETERRYPDPQLDLALAIAYLRGHAQEYGIDPDDILLLGASAGGHLCASVTARHREYEGLLMQELKEWRPENAARYDGISARPDKVCLCYPVISFEKEQHEGSFQALTGGKEELRSALSVERLVDESFPKTFLWTLEDDDCVPPSNAVRMAESLKKAGVEHRLLIYPSGGHGCHLAFCKSARGWSSEMLAYMRER